MPSTKVYIHLTLNGCYQCTNNNSLPHWDFQTEFLTSWKNSVPNDEKLLPVIQRDYK